jgi:hypothetical protein
MRSPSRYGFTSFASILLVLPLTAQPSEAGKAEVFISSGKAIYRCWIKKCLNKAFITEKTRQASEQLKQLEIQGKHMQSTKANSVEGNASNSH